MLHLISLNQTKWGTTFEPASQANSTRRWVEKGEAGWPGRSTTASLRGAEICYIFFKHYSTLHFSHAKIIFLQSGVGRRLSGGSVYSTPFGQNALLGRPFLLLGPLRATLPECGLCKQRNSKGKQKLRQRQMSSSRQLDGRHGQKLLGQGAGGGGPDIKWVGDTLVNQNRQERLLPAQKQALYTKKNNYFRLFKKLLFSI